jgi:hypothetical protein
VHAANIWTRAIIEFNHRVEATQCASGKHVELTTGLDETPYQAFPANVTGSLQSSFAPRRPAGAQLGIAL